MTSLGVSTRKPTPISAPLSSFSFQIPTLLLVGQDRRMSSKDNNVQIVQQRHHLRLPNEIWANVIFHIDDRRDLARLLRTCRPIQTEAERILYRRLLVRVTGSLLLSRLSILPPRLANHVYSIDIDYGYVNDEQLRLEEDMMRQSLARLHNLKVLCLPGTGCLRPLDPDKPLPFRLVEFSTSAFNIRDLVLFFRSQPSIQVLKWKPTAFSMHPSETKPTLYLDDDILPNLTTLQTTVLDVMRDVLRPSANRRLKRLGITLESVAELEGLTPRPSLEVLLTPLPLPAILTLRPELFPNLRYLECVVSFTDEPFNTDAAYLLQLKSLRKLKLWHPAPCEFALSCWVPWVKGWIVEHPALIEVDICSVFDDYVRMPEQLRLWVRVDSKKTVVVHGPIVFDSEHPECVDEWMTWT